MLDTGFRSTCFAFCTIGGVVALVEDSAAAADDEDAPAAAPAEEDSATGGPGEMSSGLGSLCNLLRCIIINYTPFKVVLWRWVGGCYEVAGRIIEWVVR